MALDKKKSSLGKLLLIIGYLESFKFVVFYSVNIENSLFSIIVPLAVLACFYILPLAKSVTARFLGGFLLFLLIVTAVILAPPNFLSGVITFIYALLVLLLTRFILERNSAGEIFFLCGLFEAAAVFSSDRGILIYIIINLVFALALNIQLHISGIENNPRVRFIDGSGIKKNLISLAVLIILICVGTVPLIFLKEGLVAENLRPLTFLSKKTAVQAVEDDFWHKLRNFEFNGQVPVDDTPVMRVKSPRPSYWRGETADFYTGRGWINSMMVRAAGEQDFSNPLPPNIPVSKIGQVFNFYPWQGSQTIYSGGAAAGIREVAAHLPTGQAEKAALLADDGGNLYFSEFKPALVYQVFVYMPEIDQKLLEQYSKDRVQGLSRVNPKYLQLPEIPERVRSLSEKLTRTAQGPYAKAREIERFLSTEYPYNLTVTPLPEGRELTDFFLFDLKRGYCTYHSTAMVVMLRSIGIPARWVTGFTTGDYEPEQGSYVVKQSDAHAWVEAYVDGIGWVPFEPTADFTIPGVKGTAPAVDRAPAAKPLAVTTRETGLSFPAPGLMVILTFTLAVLIVRRRNKKRYKGGAGGFYEEFLQLMARRGYYKDAAQTPCEFADHLLKTGKFDGSYKQIMSITRAYERDRYGPAPIEYSEEKEIITVLKELARQLK